MPYPPFLRSSRSAALSHLYRFHADRWQFENSIAVEKRLSLIVEQLKRMQNVMKTIKSGALHTAACQLHADIA